MAICRAVGPYLYRAAKANGSADDFAKALREACGEDFTTAESLFKSWMRSVE
jgi:hypothetical protein